MAKKDALNSLLDNIDADSDLNFYGVNLLDEKEFVMFIKRTEHLCRKSQEYDMWQKRTKAMAVNQNSDPLKDDAVCCPICGVQYEYAPAESHHHPITLFNLCVRNFQEWIDNQELSDKRPLDLVQEVMEKHLCNEVEHVVLCKHCHEKYHNGEQVTKEELQKIIDFKRAEKINNYPQTIKDLVLLKKEREARYMERRKIDNETTLGNLHEDTDVNELKASIINHINAEEFFEEIKEKYSNNGSTNNNEIKLENQ